MCRWSWWAEQSKVNLSTKQKCLPVQELRSRIPWPDPLTSDLWATLMGCFCLHLHLRCGDWNANSFSVRLVSPFKTAYLHYHRCCFWPWQHRHPPDTCPCPSFLSVQQQLSPDLLVIAVPAQTRRTLKGQLRLLRRHWMEKNSKQVSAVHLLWVISVLQNFLWDLCC